MKSLSELTIILHRVGGDKGNFVYQRRDDLRIVEEENIEFLKTYPNPILVRFRGGFLESVRCSEYIPDEADAIVVGHGDNEINPAVYCKLHIKIPKQKSF